MSLVRWLRLFHFKKRGNGRGAKPRYRSYSSKVQRNTEPVPGLPRNAYCEKWLQSLSDYELEELRINDTEFEILNTQEHPRTI